MYVLIAYMKGVAMKAPGAFLLVLASTPPWWSGTRRWISISSTIIQVHRVLLDLVYGSSSQNERPGALVVTGVTSAPGVVDLVQEFRKRDSRG